MKITPHPCEELPNRVNYELTQEEFDAGQTVALMTGPIAGTIVLSSGSAVDVTPYYAAVREEDRQEALLAIHRAHHAAGRFMDAPLPQGG